MGQGGGQRGQGGQMGDGGDMKEVVKEILGFVKDLINGMQDKADKEEEAPECPKPEQMPIPCSISNGEQSISDVSAICGEESQCNVGPVNTMLTPNWQYTFCSVDCRELAAKIAKKKVAEYDGEEKEGGDWSDYGLEDLIYFKKVAAYQENILNAYLEACASALADA